MSPHNAHVARCAKLIYDGFIAYNNQFAAITARAARRFEQRDWKGQFRDIAERVELYEQSVCAAHRKVTEQFAADLNDADFWAATRDYVGSRLAGVPDAGFMKTFFNSITRRCRHTVGVNPALEFAAAPPDEGMETLESLSMRRYPCWGDARHSLREVLSDFELSVPYRDLEADTAWMYGQLQAGVQGQPQRRFECIRFEFIDAHFYQGARAYLVGRVLHPGHDVSPIVIALANGDQGIDVDALLMQEEAIGTVFSYTRSYYFADPTSVVAAVQFLHTILPRKPIDELYTVLGRLRQGKTERYRNFISHLRRTDDLFEQADGDVGLVMLVFTLPSSNLVFKVIRDRFGYPKRVTRAEVIAKYRLVSRHDHAGRLIDTQQFNDLTLPLRRFAPALLEDLLSHAAATVSVQGDNLIIHHVYIERRVRPLNLFIRESDPQSAKEAILDYGQAIKDLAATNIFPGDLLLKNFGLTNSRRVVFYDYDEVALVSDCRFRDIPEADEDYDLQDTGVTHFVGEHDIFPEEFMRFLAMDAALRQVFLRVHGDLLTADYWRSVKRRRLQGRIEPVVPYKRQAVPCAD